MNRETKRLMQRQGQLNKDGNPAQQRSTQRVTQTAAPEERGIRAYLRNVKAELRKVKWPSRLDVINYAGVVLIALVVIIALIFGLNYVFSKAVFFLFK